MRGLIQGFLIIRGVQGTVVKLEAVVCGTGQNHSQELLVGERRGRELELQTGGRRWGRELIDQAG